MLRYLFPRLTADAGRGAELFRAVTTEARRPHWYLDGGVDDTLDGRFAMVATVTALVLVRLERDRELGEALAVSLTERFVEVMESEHRELGLGDRLFKPANGRRPRSTACIRRDLRRTKRWSTPPDNWSNYGCGSKRRQPTRSLKGGSDERSVRPLSAA
jgi:cytochrome b pre-mRNA-processing protein 3